MFEIDLGLVLLYKSKAAIQHVITLLQPINPEFHRVVMLLCCSLAFWETHVRKNLLFEAPKPK